MASIIPDEGLDKIFSVFPKNGTNLASLYMGLFTSQTETTVPARDAVGGETPSGWTEATGTDYARQEVGDSDWGAEETSGDGRKITASQIQFPAVGSGGWGTVTGFFLATHVSSQAGDTIIYFANFDDVTEVELNEYDIIRITPSMILTNVS